MANFDKAIKTLEFDKIQNMLADCAATDGAREEAIRLMPERDGERIKKLLLQTDDAKKLASIKGAPSFYGVLDIIGAVERAEKGAVLTPKELLNIAVVLRTSRSLLDYINVDKRADYSLDEIFERLTPNRFLEDKITRALPAEDLIADEASPELSEIRRKIRNTNNRIKDTLQKYVTGGSYAKYLQENIVTMRNGRYVIPVKAEYKNEIKGLVHDTSASGATMFIEPVAVIEANNDLRELELKEKREIERILAALSVECAEYADNLRLNYYNITKLAFIFAKAELSFRMNAARPIINSDRRVELHGARHPLLDKNTVVPIDISLGVDFDTLVITGPNTGGKTVSLKTLGLFALMTQAGLHIPASDSSTICVFDDVLADIGDEQSIEQSLSTFSSHMVNIVKILEVLNDNCLVLLDELGAGTDPVEGAALAVSILERIRAERALCAATTHYAELKTYALDTERVMNAACEFDISTLKPTYRLIIGAPGKSNAFAITQRLGLDPEVISRAEKLVSSGNRRFEDVIEKLEASRIEMEHQREEAEKNRREYEQYRADAERKLNAKIARTEKELQNSQAKAMQLLEGAKASSDYVFAKLDELQKQKDNENFADTLERARDDLRKRLRSAKDAVNPVNEITNDDYVLPRALKRGDEVLMVNINKNGVLLDEPDKNGDVTVQAGIIKTKTNVSNLRLIETKNKMTDNQKKQQAAANYRVVVQKNFKPELDLRGLTGDDAWFMTDKYLDEAQVAGIKSVTLIHGKGTGALRNALWKYLKSDSRVEEFRIGAYGEGDLGVTVVTVK